tara:strand:+ start:122 stop:424 length:303 start_codon:yes stop_codon:yes gene_type:complete
MFGFHLDYYLCSVLAVSGVLFIVVAYQKSSLSPVPCCFGVIFMLAAAILFFSTDNRIVNDYQGGLDANEQAVLFALAALTAFIIRKLFSAGERVIRKNTN